MPEAFDVDRLHELKNLLLSIRRSHVATMNHYVSGDGHGFWHQPSKRGKASRSSTATCVSSLVRANLWEHPKRTWGTAQEVSEKLLKKEWQSAGLDENNPFTLSFIAEGVLDVAKAEDYDGKAEHLALVREEIVPLLAAHLNSEIAPFGVKGAVAIAPYPPSAYLTQVVFRVLDRCKEHVPLEPESLAAVRRWSVAEIHRQIALLATESRIADPLQLGYAIVLAVSSQSAETTTPEDKALFSGALRIFFEHQSADGLWPLSQPIFHYPDVGNAHCFEYELLTQLMGCEMLWEELLAHLDKLEKAAKRLTSSAFELGAQAGGQAMGWASGHHPQIAGPESWSTACVFDFVHGLDRLAAEANRRVLFREVGSIYSPPLRNAKRGEFAPDFQDAPLWDGSKDISLTETIFTRFVEPIANETASVAYGGSLSKSTAMAGILFGPPGTSKTQLAKHIANYLGWPLLSVDPSYVIQDGIDHIHTRANTLFRLLTMAEEVVVLLDEFDEMGRDRDKNNDILSRFITTSMLPKLAAINESRKIVVLLATNYVDRFDAAFSRGGRFDMVVQVMPPFADAKVEARIWKPVLADSIAKIKDAKRDDAKKHLQALTFLETVQLVKRLDGCDDPLDEINLAYKDCTLHRENDKWAKQCEKDRSHLRLPS